MRTELNFILYQLMAIQDELTDMFSSDIPEYEMLDELMNELTKRRNKW